MLIAALFTIAKIWKQPRCPPIDEWINKIIYICIYIHIHDKIIYKMICIHAIKYYSVKKKNKILPFATTWIDLEGIMLSKISQMEKDKYCMISLTWEI